MKRLWMLTLVTLLAANVGSAQAQLFGWFRKSSAPALPPAERVSQLVNTIKTDPDERKRTQAVEALREFDVKSFPEIVSVLSDAAQNDSKAGVRSEAVNSLVRIRPVTPTAGQAIEYAAAKDENWRNRMNAQAALVRYKLAGYSASMPSPIDPKQGPQQTKEPPIVDRPPVIYYDQYGKVIPAPKNFPGPVVPAPRPNGYPQGVPPSSYPGMNAVPVSNPKGQPPFATIGPAPQPIQPSVEPVFRSVNKLPTPPTQIVPPTGPALDLPPLPINGAPVTPPPGPSLDPSIPGGSSLPTGRMEPSPRLEPAP